MGIGLVEYDLIVECAAGGVYILVCNPGSHRIEAERGEVRFLSLDKPRLRTRKGGLSGKTETVIRARHFVKFGDAEAKLVNFEGEDALRVKPQLGRSCKVTYNPEYWTLRTIRDDENRIVRIYLYNVTPRWHAQKLAESA